ncbi:MAG: sulfite exporter TauE/SafE family protein [Candidatus Adiutrix sp.]|jgi:sulfite exporter TauE/SafE/copper chaperone CopZ|nr:sulfite exporter TauE/SafE family protein [Candidatus Adiutrix sp.]
MPTLKGIRETALKTTRLRVGGLTCAGCQNKIEKKLRHTAGVISADVSYGAGTAVVSYDSDLITLEDIAGVIKSLDYQVPAGNERPEAGARRIAGLVIIIASLYFLLRQFGLLNLLAPGRLAETNMSYGMLFVIGLITSVHCVAMCGGINLSQCLPKGAARPNEGRLAAMRPGLMYNLGRLGSYTTVGFIVGALGSAITFSNNLQGVLKLIAGLFMVIMGLNLLGLFPGLRKLSPQLPKIFARKIDAEKAGSGNPLYVGWLNGLMPCGPLQAMQIYALSTGSPLTGALSMLLFALGTTPLVFGLGAVSSLLGQKFTQKATAVGAVLVVVLGLSMFSQGWSLSGFTLDWPAASAPATARNSESGGEAVIENGVQIVNSTLRSGRYPNITVQAKTPVKWIIEAPKGTINGCNNRILIKEYAIEHKFQAGRNVIEFTPVKTGTVRYSCWMGMIRGTITVLDGGGAAAAPESPSSALINKIKEERDNA